jgi:NAD(P) transhydrogenase subunit alpha
MRLSWEDCERLVRPQVARFATGRIGTTAAEKQRQKPHLLIVGVPRESYPDERRVRLVPMVVPNLLKAGLDVVIEAGAGVEAG